MRQLLSIVLSFSVLLSSVPVAQGQPVTAASKNKDWLNESWIRSANREMPSDTTSWPNHLQKKVQVFETQFKQQTDSADEKLFKAGEELAKTKCHYEGLSCASEEAFKALLTANWDPLQGEVCSEDGKTCVPLLAFAQGAIHWGLQEELFYKGQMLVSSIPAFTSLVVTYGVHSKEDQEAALEFFYQVIEEAKKDCGKSYMEYGSSARRADARQATEKRTKRCNQEMSAVYGAAMLSTTQTEARTINSIVSLLNEKYDSAAASVVIPAAASALATIGTPLAYEALYDFLMDESIPSFVGDTLNAVSVEGIAKGALGAVSDIRGADFRYLNRINESFQYIDTQEAKRQGYRSALNNENIQYPYGNLLEDVGRLLGEESGNNKAAAAVAQKIIKQANGYLKGKRLKQAWQNSDTIDASSSIHYPVVLGILDGWRSHGKKFIYVPSPELLKFLYTGDWWDLNEGTQQRVHYKAWQFAKARGWGWKKPVKDAEKQQRYVYNKRILDIAQGTDLALMPVLLVSLVASVPSMAKGLANSVRWLRANRKFIGYRLVSLRQPAVAQNAGKAAVSTSKQAAAPAAKSAAAPRAAVSTQRVPQAAVTSQRAVAEVPAPVAQPSIMAELEPTLTKPVFNEPKLSSISGQRADKSLLGALDRKVQGVSAPKTTAVESKPVLAEEDADLARFLDDTPLVARGVNKTPKSGGWFRKIFKSKTQKILDEVEMGLNNLPEGAIARKEKLSELYQKLNLNLETTSNTTKEELSQLVDLKRKIVGQMRKPADIEIVGQSKAASAGKAASQTAGRTAARAAGNDSPGIEIVKRSQTVAKGGETSKAPIKLMFEPPAVQSPRTALPEVRAVAEETSAGVTKSTTQEASVASRSVSPAVQSPRTALPEVRAVAEETSASVTKSATQEASVASAPTSANPAVTKSVPVAEVPKAAETASPRLAESNLGGTKSGNQANVASAMGNTARQAAPVEVKKTDPFKEFSQGLQSIERDSKTGQVTLHYGKETKKISLQEYEALRSQALTREQKSLVSRLEQQDALYELQSVNVEGKYVYLQYANKQRPTRMYMEEYEELVRSLTADKRSALLEIEAKNWKSVEAIDDSYLAVRSADGKVQHLTPAQAQRLRIEVPQAELDKMARIRTRKATFDELKEADLVRRTSLAEREIVPEVVNQNGSGKLSKVLQDGLVRIEDNATDARYVNLYFLDKGRVSSRTVSYRQYKEMVENWSKADANLLKSRSVQYENRILPERARQEATILDGLYKKSISGYDRNAKEVIREQAMPIIEDMYSNGLITPQRKAFWEKRFQ